MIDIINKKLESIGSKFRTVDGLTLIMYIGHMQFIKKTFNSQQETFTYIDRIAL